MKVHVTCVTNHRQDSVARMAQQMIADVGRQLGYEVCPIYTKYTTPHQEPDSLEELLKRLDDLGKKTAPGDAVIFQFPTWNHYTVDANLLSWLKSQQRRVIIFLHDYVPVMYKESRPLAPQFIAMLNQAEVIIVPSVAMYEVLKKHGLTVKKYVVQGIWDHLTQKTFVSPTFQRQLHFLGSPERFNFVNHWQSALPLRLYTQKLPRPMCANVLYEGYFEDEVLLAKLAEAGGFGLVWHSDDDLDYMRIYSPYKLGTYLAAGLPIVARRGFAQADLIEKHGLGLVVSSFDELERVLETMTEETYHKMAQCVADYRPFLTQPYHTQQILSQAVACLFS